MSRAPCPAAHRGQAIPSLRSKYTVRLAIGLLLALTCRSFGQEVTGEQVLRAIDAGRRFLLSSQHADGSWPDVRPYIGGTTAIATLALLNTGVPPSDPAMQSALRVVQAIPLERTYVVSLKAQALSLADPKAYQAEIKAAANWLIRAQRQGGLWGYLLEGNQVDFSNSQFALLGLHEAANAGAEVPNSVWRRAEGAYRQSQRQDGGFVYTPSGRAPTGSMTAAAVASLYITGNSLAVHVPEPTSKPNGPCCGHYSIYRPISRGLLWLDRNFSVKANPVVFGGKTGNGGWKYYYLYGLERVGMLSGLQYIGTHDWYREGAAEIVAKQSNNGAWRDTNLISDTAFALLFLAKGHRPVLFQKLRWSNDHRWSIARNDLAHLCGFLGSRIGGKPVSWNVVELRTEVRDLLAAPILYISGQEFPELKPAEIECLRKYVDMGGTILVESTCSRAATREGFIAFTRQAFSDQEPQRLPPDHPVFSAMYKLSGDTIELEGLDVGCRTSVFFSPTDLACQWENGDYKKRNRIAFELGANIAVYATALEPLRDKLAPPPLFLPETASRPTEVPRGALYLAVLKHGADWRPFPRAIENLTEFLNRNLGVDVVPAYESVAATDPRLAGHPIVYMTGARPFALADEEIAALRQHLVRGGMLLGDACCGQRLFDASFRELVGKLFPDAAFDRLPPDHPILTGSPGFSLKEVTYLPTLQAERPDLKEPWLEGITIEGRTAVVYSPFGLGCGLADSGCFGCLGLAPDDARKLTANIVLYGLSH